MSVPVFRHSTDLPEGKKGAVCNGVSDRTSQGSAAKKPGSRSGSRAFSGM
jgi:hypothetical protein